MEIDDKRLKPCIARRVSAMSMAAERHRLAMSKRNGWGAIRRLPSKQYQASYTGPDMQRYLAPDTFITKTEAGDWLARIRVEI